MKIKTKLNVVAPVLLALATINCELPLAHAQGTAFTYQGWLNSGGAPASGSYDLAFSLFTTNNTGTAEAGPVTNSAVSVSNGLFVATLDFGNVFSGTNYWLQLAVRTNGNGAFVALSPRQRITPTPYAIAAANLSSVIAYNSPGGSYATVGGGLGNVSGGIYPVVGGGLDNVSTGIYSTVAGGMENFATNSATVGGGGLNIASGQVATIAGGDNNNAAGYYATIGGGYVNLASGIASTIGGGEYNVASNNVATVGGGVSNIAGGDSSTVGGGDGNQATGLGSTVGGGENNVASSSDATVGGGSYNTASNYDSTVGGGYENVASGIYSVISGGDYNTASNYDSAVGGGYDNTASGEDSTIGGGDGNIASGYNSTVVGGLANSASGNYSTVAGGAGNSAAGLDSFAAGYRANAVHDGSFVWNDGHNGNTGIFSSTVPNQFAVHANGGARLVGNVTTGDISLSENGAYHNLSMSGGNSTGFLYGSYNYYGDGIHLGYNFYADAAGAPQVPHPGAPTSRISASYGSVALATGPNDTPPTDRLFVDSTGRVGIGRTPTANLLEVAGNASKTTAGSWLANSDARIKTRITTVTNALETLARVRLVSFHYADDYRATHPGIEDRSYLNVIAQEFARVFPDAVKGSGEKLPAGGEILQVDTYPLTIYSAAALQELNQKLEAENAALKARLDKLEQLVNSMQRTGQ
jgi:Chaperone of endosialidase